MGIFPVHIVDISSLSGSFHACVNVLKFKLYLYTIYASHQLLLHVVEILLHAPTFSWK